MSVRVTIETASKAEAELIAQRLPVRAQAQAWRGYGVIRVEANGHQETEALIDAVWQGFEENKLRWTRVRYGDEERVFRANGQNGHRPATGSPGP